MKTAIIIQARMSSKRFPGKMLYKVAGKPMLKYTLERLANCAFENTLVVATSVEKDDDVLADYCATEGVECYRGLLDNVANRFACVIDEYDLDCFVRVNGDSPLLDQQMIDKAVDVFASGDYDLVTNVMPRTFPFGQSVEVVRAEPFLEGCEKMVLSEDLEHVTKYFYAHHDDYRIKNISAWENFLGIRFCVDDQTDMDLFTGIVARMDRPQCEYALSELVQFYREEHADRLEKKK